MVLSSNNAAISILGPDPEKIIGYSLESVCGNSRRAIVRAVENAFETGKYVSEYQITGQSENGHGWTYVVTVSPLSTGMEEGVVVIIRDITRLRVLESEVSERFSFKNIIGKSPQMLKIFDMVRHLANTDTTVLIGGESGTGKELIASALHHHGIRNGGPLVTVNCAALPETLLESELFGHVRGSFTGANRDKAGRFELANGGTIFLDEVGDVSEQVQKRLLRVLQEREIERVGSTKKVKVDVRVVAATNSNLLELVSSGVFRDDLYYRLKVVQIDLPPLRERLEDIPLLINHFLDKLQARLGRIIEGISPAAMEILLGYHWPGNIRQLENTLEHAVVLNQDRIIRPENLPTELTQTEKPVTTQVIKAAEDISPERLRKVLESVAWNRSEAAKILDVHRNTIWRKMKKYGLTPSTH